MRRLIFAFLSIFIILSVLLRAETPTRESVTRLYVATFKRAPDSAGLNYWTNNSGLTLSQIAQSFFDQPETQILYPPETSNRDFIKSVYANLFNREPDEAGWDYWEKELNRGAFSKNRFIEAVINGAQDSDVSFDATILSNKTTVSLYFTDNNLNDIILAKEVMINIDAGSQSVIDAEAMIDLFIESGQVNGGADSEFIPNHTFDERGDSWVLANGATIEVPPGAVSGSTSVDFEKTVKPEDLGEEAIVYDFSSDAEVKNASFVLPVGLSDINKKEDIVLIYARSEDSAYNVIDFDYNASLQTVDFTIKNNWTFNNIPENIKGSSEYQRLNKPGIVSSFISTILIIKNKMRNTDYPSSMTPIPMPYFTQMGPTCWAASGQMLEHSLYSAGMAPGTQIYSFMKFLDISSTQGIKSDTKYLRFTKFIAGNKGQAMTLKYYSTHNVKDKILELLNQNHQVLFARGIHQVLLVGYIKTSDSIEFIQHNPSYPDPTDGRGMYEEMEFYDSFYTDSQIKNDPSLKDKEPWVKVSRLVWVETGLNPARALQTVTIPKTATQYDIYFYGGNSAADKSIKIELDFNNTVTDGYRWKKTSGFGTYIDGAFPKNIERFVIELPVWNADIENSADLSLDVKIYEEGNPFNEVNQSIDFTLPPKGYAVKKFTMNIRPLLTSLNTESNFILSIILFKGVKLMSDIQIEKIVLQPVEDEISFPRTYTGSGTMTRNLELFFDGGGKISCDSPASWSVDLYADGTARFTAFRQERPSWRSYFGGSNAPEMFCLDVGVPGDFLTATGTWSAATKQVSFIINYEGVEVPLALDFGLDNMQGNYSTPNITRTIAGFGEQTTSEHATLNMQLLQE